MKTKLLTLLLIITSIPMTAVAGVSYYVLDSNDNKLYLSANGVPSDGNLKNVFLKRLSSNTIVFNQYKTEAIRVDTLGSYDVNNSRKKYCLNAYNPGHRSNVSLYECINNDPEQKWDDSRSVHSVIRFELKNHGLCVNAYNPSNYSNVNLYACDDNDNEQIFYPEER